jgi:hypothetical protein
MAHVGTDRALAGSAWISKGMASAACTEQTKNPASVRNPVAAACIRGSVLAKHILLLLNVKINLRRAAVDMILA